MTETLEQMEIRHAMERAELMKRLVRHAYKAGSENRVLRHGPRLAMINHDVAQKHGVSASEMRSHVRKRKIAHARFEAFSKAKTAGFSLTQIGNYWGGRDHTTVLSGIRRHKQLSAQKTVGFDQ